MPKWSEEKKAAAREARAAEQVRSAAHFAAMAESRRQREVARIEELRRLAGDDGQTVVLRRAVFESLAMYAIGYADFVLGMRGSPAEVPALLLPEFRALLSPELVSRLDDCFSEGSEA